MAGILILASLLPDVIASMVMGFADPDALSVTFRFEAGNLAIMVFGVVAGLISEIFRYGYQLQDDMDAIA